MFTRKKPPVLDELLLRRVAVNTIEGETLFTGRFANYDDTTFVFEQCETVTGPGETPNPIKGRQYIDRIHVFPTELPT